MLWESWSSPYSCLLSPHFWRDINLEPSFEIELFEDCENIGGGPTLGDVAPKGVAVGIVHEPENDWILQQMKSDTCQSQGPAPCVSCLRSPCTPWSTDPSSGFAQIPKDLL